MTEQSLLERVAREICNIKYIDADHVHDGFTEPNWKACIDEARAVLMAIREPNQAMIDAGFQARDNERSPIAIWQAMIDAALEKKPAHFDLIYVSGPAGRTMTCAITDGNGDSYVGPFLATEAGPKIVDALMARPEFGFADRKEAEKAYMLIHFRNMARNANEAGQPYPYKAGLEEK